MQDVILTHLHYDHVGGFNRFPKAKFHLQEPEIHYATGRYMQYHRLAHSFEVEDIVGVVRLNFAHRVQFYNGGAELAPGITLHPVGGHSMGLQFVKVHTKRGWVVVASDTTHYYENMMTGRPFTTAFHIGLMLEAYDTLRERGAEPAAHRARPRPQGDAVLSAADRRSSPASWCGSMSRRTTRSWRRSRSGGDAR